MTLIEYAELYGDEEGVKIIKEALSFESIFTKEVMEDMNWEESGKRDLKKPEEFTGLATDNGDSFIINGGKIERL